MSQKVIDISTNIYKNLLGESTDTSIPSISTYLRYNVGNLNVLLGECFNVNNCPGTNYLEIINGQNINCLINNDAAAIYCQLYLMGYFERLIRQFTGVGNINQVIQVSSDEGTVRFTDRAGLAKVYIQLRKDAETTLDKMVNKYKFNKQTAKQVEGDDVYVRYAGGENGSGELYQRDIY